MMDTDLKQRVVSRSLLNYTNEIRKHTRTTFDHDHESCQSVYFTESSVTVPNREQREAMSGRGGGADRPHSGFDCLCNCGAIEFASTSRHQRARDRAHHVTKKAFGADFDLDYVAAGAFVASLADVKTRDGSDAIFDVGLRGGECGPIVAAEKEFRG